MNKKEKKRKELSKTVIRIVCLVLAISMIATTFFMLIQYLMAL